MDAIAKELPQGVLGAKSVATLPATTASGSFVGMIRFNTGFSLKSLAIVSEDLDTSTNVQLDVGYVYDDSVSGSDDPNAFLDGLDIAQDAGSRTWPVDDGLLTGTGFVAAGPGFIIVEITDANTTTAGDITLDTTFTYDD